MASGEEIVRQIGALAEALGQELAEVRHRVETLTAELAEARAGSAELLAARQGDLEVAEKRIESLVQKLKVARQESADAQEQVRRELQQRLETAERTAAEARDELEQERSIRKRLEKGAVADEKRLSELEKTLAERKGGSARGGDGAIDAEIRVLQGELSESLETVMQERRAKAELEGQLAETHKLIEALESALKRARQAPREATGGARDEKLRQLAEQLAAVEAQLEEERSETQRRVLAQAAAEMRIATLEQALSAAESHPDSRGREISAPRSPAEKPLPHDLRPAPKAGALFRPDWNLEGLPCKSVEQVLQAWCSVFNVRLSLEGYPSQYCTAFLVVLKQGKQKQLYMVFNLKLNKHVLVCVPGKPPTDEAGLTKLVGEGQKYLQLSGFELEKVMPDDMERVLGAYLKG